MKIVWEFWFEFSYIRSLITMISCEYESIIESHIVHDFTLLLIDIGWLLYPKYANVRIDTLVLFYLGWLFYPVLFHIPPSMLILQLYFTLTCRHQLQRWIIWGNRALNLWKWIQNACGYILSKCIMPQSLHVILNWQF